MVTSGITLPKAPYQYSGAAIARAHCRRGEKYDGHNVLFFASRSLPKVNHVATTNISMFPLGSRSNTRTSRWRYASAVILTPAISLVDDYPK